jgi:hypothetical protein
MKWLHAARHLIGRIIGSFDLLDIAGVTGFGLLVYGVSEINREASFIVAGVILLGFAVTAARK